MLAKRPGVTRIVSKNVFALLPVRPEITLPNQTVAPALIIPIVVLVKLTVPSAELTAATVLFDL